MACKINGMRIFIVEDNQANASIAQLLLEQESAKVIRGRWGGPDTIELLRQNLPVDLVLMDLMLPNGVTGFDVFKAIKAESDLCDIPVIAVSASDPSSSVPKAKEMGFNGYIAKPINMMQFINQLCSILDGQDRWHLNRNMEI